MGKRDGAALVGAPAASKPRSGLLLKVAGAACLVLLTLAYTSQRPAGALQQGLQQQLAGKAYVGDLSLGLDVGSVVGQVRGGAGGRSGAGRRLCALRLLPICQLELPNAGTAAHACMPNCRMLALRPMHVCLLGVGQPQLGCACLPACLVCPQEEADAWCAPRPQPAWPPSPDQLRQLRVAIVIDPICRKWVLPPYPCPCAC
jgi:hypothetical protein